MLAFQPLPIPTAHVRTARTMTVTDGGESSSHGASAFCAGLSLKVMGNCTVAYLGQPPRKELWYVHLL